MATGTIKNSTVKIANGVFSNLSQYNPQSYYLYIDGVKQKAGIPADATLISAQLSGWSNLGTNVSISVSADNSILVIFTYGTSVTSSSYITSRIAYI